MLPTAVTGEGWYPECALAGIPARDSTPGSATAPTPQCVGTGPNLPYNIQPPGGTRALLMANIKHTSSKRKRGRPSSETRDEQAVDLTSSSASSEGDTDMSAADEASDVQKGPEPIAKRAARTTPTQPQLDTYFTPSQAATSSSSAATPSPVNNGQ